MNVPGMSPSTQEVFVFVVFALFMLVLLLLAVKAMMAQHYNSVMSEFEQRDAIARDERRK